jgi:hypothetical protein
MKLATLSLAVTALVASIAGASAQTATYQAGTLECHGGQNVGFVVGSVANLECVFHGGSRRPDTYIATVHRIGADLGFTEETTVAWTVTAPDVRLARGQLAGQYGGVGANASVGVGFGGNFLVGGPRNAYGLQPISLQGQTGFNVAAGVVSIDLDPIGVERRGHRRHHRHG